MRRPFELLFHGGERPFEKVFHTRDSHLPRFMNGVEHALPVRVSIFKEIPETYVNVEGVEFVRGRPC